MERLSLGISQPPEPVIRVGDVVKVIAWKIAGISARLMAASLS
jgi:hypothetical protein